MKKKTIAVILTVLTAVSLTTGCGSTSASESTASGSEESAVESNASESADATSSEAGSTSSETTNESSSEAETEVTTVKVAAGSTYAPYCYVDEDGNHTGYDVELLRAVDERLPQYEFEIEATTIDDLLLGLDTGNYALGSHSLNKTAEREEKYLFGTEDTGYKNFWILARKDSDIQSVEDLVGKTVLDKPGKSFYSFIESYNEENPDAQINLVGIDDLTSADRIKYIAEGKYDASAENKYTFEKANAEIGADVELKDLAFSAQTYFLYSQGQEELRDAVDEVLKELKADGTLSELSLTYLGEDVTIDYSEQ